MNILLIPSWYPNNPSDTHGVFFRDQAIALAQKGHRVYVLAINIRSLRTLFNADSKQLKSYENDEGVKTYRKQVWAILPRVPYGNYFLWKLAAKRLFKKFVKEHGLPDIIHAHSAIFGGAVAACIAKEYSIPLVLTEHSSGFARDLYADWQLKLAEKAIAEACSLISVSPSLGELLESKFPFSKDLWRWVPNVVADRFEVKMTKDDKQVSIIFLNIALMTENKGQFDLLRAFHSFTESGHCAELWLAGDGPIRIALEEKASALNISEKVRFLGMLAPEKVPDILGKADVLVVSSHYETFGVVIAEALMVGLPVISTKCGGPECIVGEGDGVLVPAKKPDALSTAMRDLSENIDSFDSESIAKRARARFSGSKVADRLIEEYTQVLSSNENKINRA